ncbi:alpha/beta hydrolase [Aeromicrobium sp.]|uniref:alpha/beta hydrolase n=1 Tax=Aeromicrobium sp. TaxID=1871063 RepID=UPI003C652BF3
MVLTPDSADFLRLLEEDAKAVAGWSYEQLREAARAAAMAADDRIGLDDVRDVDADSVPCRLYRPRIGAPVALYVHGGGWVLHDLETHDAFCRELAHRTGWALLAVDFRRSPEHPYPAPLDDVETAARWLREEGRGLRLATEMVAGIGDSAGANLLAGLTVRAPGLLDALVLMYPPVDAAAAFADEDNAALDANVMREFWDAYAPGSVGENPEVSPLRADLSDFPPTLVITAEHDILRDQGEAFAAALAGAGVDVTAWRALGTMHGFWRQPTVLAASRAAVSTVGAFLSQRRA